VSGVIYSLARVSSEIIEVSFENMFEIVKIKGHGMLEGCSDVFKAKRIFLVCKITPRKNKLHLVLILGFDLNSIIS
jgi:hypothetical protein